MPADRDPEGTIEARALDAVEEAAVESGIVNPSQSSGSYSIQHQRELSQDELAAMYGTGQRLLLGMSGRTPLAHVSMGNRWRAGIAEQVAAAVQEQHACPICLEPATDELGPLVRRGAACQHTFHLQCILQWELSPGNQCCPVCRQPYSGGSSGDSHPAVASPAVGVLLPLTVAIVHSAAFSPNDLRASTIAEHSAFLRGLQMADRLTLPTQGGGIPTCECRASKAFRDSLVIQSPDIC